MITTSEAQKKTIKNYEKQIAELESKLKSLNDYMKVYITSILEGEEVKENETYQKNTDYNFIKIKD